VPFVDNTNGNIQTVFSCHFLIRLLLLLLSLSLLCRVFTIMYLKQTMFLGYIMLELLFICNLCFTNIISPEKYVVYFYLSTFRSVRAVPNMDFFWNSLISCL
jgi:hypothetical protein